PAWGSRLDAPVGAFGPRQSLPQVDDTAVAERANRLAALRVDRLHVAVDGEDQPPVLAVGARPIVDAAARDAVQSLVDPDLFARRRIERDERVVPAEHVHHAVDDDRVEARLAVWIEPRNLEPADVRFIDLIEVDEMRVGGVAAVVRPPRVGWSCRERNLEKSGNRRDDDRLLHAAPLTCDPFRLIASTTHRTMTREIYHRGDVWPASPVERSSGSRQPMPQWRALSPRASSGSTPTRSAFRSGVRPIPIAR